MSASREVWNSIIIKFNLYRNLFNSSFQYEKKLVANSYSQKKKYIIINGVV